MAPLFARQHSDAHTDELTPLLENVLRLWRTLLSEAKPRKIPLMLIPRRKVGVVYTDAQLVPPQVALLFMPPESQPVAFQLRVPSAALDQLEDPDHAINQFEAYGQDAAVFNLNDVMAGLAVKSFIDNQVALAGLMSGYSGKGQSASANILWCFAYVWARDNPIDRLSRDEAEAGWAFVRKLGVRILENPLAPPLDAGLSL